MVQKWLMLAFCCVTSVLCAEWTLVFSDEFTQGERPDAAKWRYEKGFVRNREPQYYFDATENVGIRDGALYLTARQLKQPMANPAYDPTAQGWMRQWPEAHFTSGSIDTKGRFAFQYGKVEVRAKLPVGKGLWPAIWTMGVKGRHPDCGEIDVMEWVQEQFSSIWSTVHFKGRELVPANQRYSLYTAPEVTDGQWHLFGMVWTAETITFTFDDQPFFTFQVDVANRPDGTNPFRQPHYLKLNLALGSEANWGGPLDESLLPAAFVIDYVRIWQE